MEEVISERYGDSVPVFLLYLFHLLCAHFQRKNGIVLYGLQEDIVVRMDCQQSGYAKEGERSMKIEEARQTYNVQIKTFYTKQRELHKQRQELDEKIKTTENGSVIYKNEAASLELQYNAVSEKRQEYQDYMDKLMEQWSNEFNKVAAKQQAEASEEAGKDLQKIMIVARRIMHGDKVPAKDEKKLMEFDYKLYTMAKNAGAMARLRKQKKYKSLWEDEPKKEQLDAKEAADNTEAFADGPEVMDVEEVMDAAGAGTEDIEIDFE